MAGTSHEPNEANRYLLKSLKTGKHVLVKELHTPMIWLDLGKNTRGKNVAYLRFMSGESTGQVEVDQADTFRILKMKAVALIGYTRPKLMTDPEFAACRFLLFGKTTLRPHAASEGA